MIKGGKGGKKPLINGLFFESRMDLGKAISQIPGYSVKDDTVYYRGKSFATLYKKFKLYRNFLEPRGVKARKVISKLLLPDDAIFIPATNTLYIIEQKYQDTSGSVDEKLQTCDFKNKQYHKLVAPLQLDVKYVYVLCDWFKKPEYHDVLKYIQDVGCYHFFEVLPLSFLGLPSSKK